MTYRPELAFLAPEFRELSDEELSYLLDLDRAATRERLGLDVFDEEDE